MEHYMDGLGKMVIVAAASTVDGDSWIWKWAEVMYPEQVQILDFYHAMEHLGSSATTNLRATEKSQQWQKIIDLNQKIAA